MLSSMDLRSILSNSEDSLPTLAQNESTAAVTSSSLPGVALDASTYWKLGGSTVLGLAGMIYLGYGKKNGDVRNMIIGAILTLCSMFLF